MHSPPYPNAHLFIHTLHVFTMYRTAMGGPANKGIYKYIQKTVYTGSMKGRVIAITQNGDLTKEVSTWSSMYIKTLTNKEKFPY